MDGLMAMPARMRMRGFAWLKLAIEIAAVAAVTITALELEGRMADVIGAGESCSDLLA